ncbi:MAG: malate dehydrogenase [Candidatus Fraserbacteria bacterium RBG_16_55_9]|uniref:Malate dehydrogenase n=1 Tax=Fraserbacteria sp. (strain RBG_16_55_9) TaxID=1817864 RepID=A0A1F5UST9_FRAXR|nr:MAG: malate dehydrogenase [Candidatus Fraserbacteria bacterium RBG_16_55_9]
MVVRGKVTIVGAGFVGATAAQRIAESNLAHVVMVDIPQKEGPTKGKALDMLESAPLMGFDSHIIGTSDYKDTSDSDVVVITAGMPRKPGMTREDLIATNTSIIKSVIEPVVKNSPKAILIVVTNPLDAMVYAAYKLSGFPRERVIGQSGALDSTRFRSFIALELGVSMQDVQALVIGGHTDVGMVPLASHASVAGIPLAQLLSTQQIEKLIERTRKGGTEIVELLGEGSAYYAPSAGVTQMVEAILLDQKRIIPSAVYLQGEYSVKDLFLCVPVILGASGMEKVIELKLPLNEQEMFKKSAELVRQTVGQVRL